MIRLLNFDIAKAICIILVVIGHYNPDTTPEWYHKIWLWIYSFHMPLFMFASGYIYIAFKKEESYLSFVAKKVKRLMVPYITVSLIVVTIKLLTQKGLYVQNPVTITSYLKILYQPEAGYFLWFVWSLFAMFLIVPNLKTKLSRAIIFGLAIILHYVPFELTQIFALQESKVMFIWFMLGVCSFDWKDYFSKVISNKTVLKIVSGFVISLFVISSIFRSQIHIFALLQTWLGIASVMIIATALSKVLYGRAMDSILMVSVSSYIIYLFHTTFEGFAKAFLLKLHFGGLNDAILFCSQATIVILCGVICPIVLHQFVLRRFKVTRFLFGLK